ncbi:hypothetical protein Ahy_B04g069428 isoform B [Arachis hypogaea]|uniref:40S ribosomal protein S3a n=1 Tax=Arachis hypogaea TaxID=3818 RepID=A0A444ZCP3_ARAHY|nr:hypothetical protein Ahy_B04g069428 isoform B [Arachis hypogaea]
MKSHTIKTIIDGYLMATNHKSCWPPSIPLHMNTGLHITNVVCPYLSPQIRRKMREIMTKQATSCDLKELVRKFIPEMIGKEIEKATSNIYPLQNGFIRKVKILKAPKFDLGKLMEVHGGDYAEDIGYTVDRPVDEPMAEAGAEVVGV